MRRYSWIAAGVLGFVCVTATPALADDGGAKLSVRVDNDADELAAEGRVAYKIEIRNKSDFDMRSAVVSQLLPPALDYESARPKPIGAEVNQVQWEVDILADETVRLELTGRVGSLGSVREVDGERRLTSTVCVAPDAGSDLDACASESDPVGPPAPPNDETERVLVPAALGVVVAGGGGYLWYRRKNIRPADV